MDARAVLWQESGLRRVRQCGAGSIRPDGSVTIRVSTGPDGVKRAGYAGLSTCGSVWACPVCSAKIAATRQAEIEAACAWWEGQGGALAMGSFTASHRAGQSLLAVWKAITDGWGSITSGRAWVRNRGTYGLEGWMRVVEVTHGRNGWHVHVHVILFLHHGLAGPARAALTAAMLGRWRTGLAKHGFGASAQHGADVRMIHGADTARVLADYFTKGVYTPDGSAAAVAALEVARGDLKGARNGNRTPFRILADFIRTGDVADLELWREWERGSKGKRQTAWSKGFRELVGLGEDRTDEEIAADELGTSDDDALVLPKDTVSATRYDRALLLELAEQSIDALITYLDRRRLHWWHAGTLEPPPPR